MEKTKSKSLRVSRTYSCSRIQEASLGGFPMKKIMLLLTYFAFSLCITKLGKAQCAGTMDLTFPCTGQNCSSSYTTSVCWWGCQSGQCYAHAGSGLCCGNIYYSASIIPTGIGCDPQHCGNARVHPPKSSALHSPHVAELRRGELLNQIELTSTLAYRPPSLIFVPDRCRHAYGLVVKDGAIVPIGGV
jgi:hypothetical protein